MLFNSLPFALFFPVALLGHFLLPSRWRWLGLLAAGHVFYMSFVPWYVLILWIAIVLDYSAARGIEGSRTNWGRDLWLAASVTGTVGLLAVFKYAGWALEMAKPLAHWLHLPLPVVELVVPLGLSFHTFQSLAYVVEVHQGRWKPERHFGIYALYVLFYPQLVAGPIERPQELLPQLRGFKEFDSSMVAAGLRRMAWGFFLKVAVADRLAPLADAAFAQPDRISATGGWIGLVAFAAQIYLDFAGYSEIARGCAQTMGVDLMRNFDRPWSAVLPSEFWHRWHMSLSTWFRDYVYKPLGGNRVSAGRRDANLLATFALSGIWHGAGAGFLVWGLWNGILLVLERRLVPKGWIGSSKIRRILAHATTAALILPSWIFFRAGSFQEGCGYLRRLFTIRVSGAANVLQELSTSGTEVLLGFAGLLLVGWIHSLAQGDPAAWIARKPASVRWPAYWAVGLFLLLFGVFDGQRFIYFQF